jgi:hypothetical protein
VRGELSVQRGIGVVQGGHGIGVEHAGRPLFGEGLEPDALGLVQIDLGDV